MNIVQVPVGDLRPAEYNPRFMTEDQAKHLEESLREFGFVDPLIVNQNEERKNVVIGGHQRLEIAKRMGFQDVPVFYVDLDLERERELNLRLNRNLGSWDWDKLANEFDIEMLQSVGFSDEELQINSDDLEAEDDEYEVVTPEVPQSKYGDLYQLGDHRLLCGDSTKREDVERLMAGERAEMVFTDPPYNVAYTGVAETEYSGKKREGITNDKMSSENYKNFLLASLANLLSVCDGSIYVCISPKEMTTLKESFENKGGHWQSFIIWAKNTFVLSGSDWQNQYEPILYGWRDNVVNHYFEGFRNEGNIWKQEPTDAELLAWAKTMIEKTPTDVWEEKKPTKSAEHPTMKPIKLVAKAVKASSLIGGGVLDLFGGSGSTLIACEQMQRKCFMMELSESYCDVIIHRWETLTGEKALKL